jgi:Co/Zn/Cd efflux system component
MGESKDGRDFEKLVIWTSAFSIAVMAGFLASLKQVNPAIQLRFSAVSVVAFIAGGVLTALFLRVVLHASKRRRTFLVLGAAIASVVGYFLIGIADTASENRSDVTIGTVIAVTVLSGVAFVLWRVGHYFESEQPEDTMPDEK